VRAAELCIVRPSQVVEEEEEARAYTRSQFSST